ncbi:MAG: biotin synthase BioB [Thomasclavelia sp.]
MDYVTKLKNKVLAGKRLTRNEALKLYDQPLSKLTNAANEIREHFCANKFDLCTIINAKNGHCSENCKFCSQSSFNRAKIECYPLLSNQIIIDEAIKSDQQGILRFSIVTSGKRLNDQEIDQVCLAIKEIKKRSTISICASLGLLNENQYRKLKNAGLTRIHNNLETAPNNFANICTTHTFEDKIKAIKAAQKEGLFVCSGGIMGLGESKEDRIDLALALRELEIKSVPVNMLNPISGTPLQDNIPLTNEEMCRIVATYRFLLPDSAIRLAGGRGLMDDKGKSCFTSGANATITGDMLTTAGISVKTDLQLIDELGFKVAYCNE